LPEVAFKPYPCARQLHAGVEALLHLIKTGDIAPERIDSIELWVPTPNVAMVDRPSAPASRAAALGSGQYVMAVTAVRGKMDLVSFDENFLCSVPVRELLAKVKVTGATELDKHFPRHWPGRAAVKTSDGRSWMHEIIIPKGERGNPMSTPEIEEKFCSLAGLLIGDPQARAVIDEVRSLDGRDSVEPLISSLRLSR
jgi:2-methylcitrate dehydratase